MYYDIFIFEYIFCFIRYVNDKKFCMNYVILNYKVFVKIYLLYFYFKKKNVEVLEMVMVVDGFLYWCFINIFGILWFYNLFVLEVLI